MSDVPTTLSELYERDAHKRDGETPNPYVCNQVVCFREGTSTWIWAGTSNITFYRAALGRLVEMGLDPTVWDYSEMGKVYDLPYALRITWTRKMSKNGRPYRDITWIERADVDQTELDRAALKMAATAFADDEPDNSQEPMNCPDCGEPMQRQSNFWICNNPPCRVTVFDDDMPPLVPRSPSEIEARLRELAPLLAKAHVEALDAHKAKVKFEQTSAVHLAAKAAKDAKDKLDEETRALLAEYRDVTGLHGRVLDGLYTLTSSQKLTLKPRVSQGHLLGWMIRNAIFLLRQVVQIDMSKLTELVTRSNGLLTAFLEMPVVVEITDSEGTEINWSKLPLPDTDTEPLPTVKIAESNGHEGNGKSTDLPF